MSGAPADLLPEAHPIRWNELIHGQEVWIKGVYHGSHSTLSSGVRLNDHCLVSKLAAAEKPLLGLHGKAPSPPLRPPTMGDPVYVDWPGSSLDRQIGTIKAISDGWAWVELIGLQKPSTLKLDVLKLPKNLTEPHA